MDFLCRLRCPNGLFVSIEHRGSKQALGVSSEILFGAAAGVLQQEERVLEDFVHVYLARVGILSHWTGLHRAILPQECWEDSQMTESKKSSLLTTDGKEPLAMTPSETSDGTLQKLVRPAPGDAQKGKQPVSMTPVTVTPSAAAEGRGRQPLAMTPVEVPAQAPASATVNATPSSSSQDTSPQAPQSNADAKD